MSENNRYQQIKRIAFVGAAINVLLGILKITTGLIWRSHALVADGIHSCADLLTDAMVLFASKYGSQDADATHPYGHQRIETAGTLLLSLLLILVGLGIAWDSLIEVQRQVHIKPNILLIPIACLSILANEWLFHYTRRVGQSIQSELVITNAWHHRTDAASSLVVLIGLIGSMAGYFWLDALAASLIACMIIKVGIDYGWNSIKELIDTAVDPNILTSIETIIHQVDGVQKIHQLRTRLMGQDIFIDVHVLVASSISVSEGHFIAQNVHLALLKNVPHVRDVTVHIDPEDDEIPRPSNNLPSRTVFEQSCLNALRNDYPEIESCIIHYLNGQITLDLILTPQKSSRINALRDRVINDAGQQPQLFSIRLLTIQETLVINDT